MFTAAVADSAGKRSTASFFRQLLRSAGHPGAVWDPSLASPESDGQVDVRAAAFLGRVRRCPVPHGIPAAPPADERRLLDMLSESGGTAVLDTGGPSYRRLRNQCIHRRLPIITYGCSHGADLQLLTTQPLRVGMMVFVRLRGRPCRLRLRLPGRSLALNALAAAGLGLAAGLEVDELAGTLPALEAPPGRLERVATYHGADIYLDDASGPEAVGDLLTDLRRRARRRLILVLLHGSQQHAAGRRAMHEVAADLADIVLAADGNRVECDAPASPLPSADDRTLRRALGELTDGDLLAIAGRGDGCTRDDESAARANRRALLEDSIEKLQRERLPAEVMHRAHQHPLAERASPRRTGQHVSSRMCATDRSP